ncbi:hypothetical protein B0H14DRAFT_3856729 [Mycena olivaceomarginata]|nr:hypothetical protein B0H14DRAFT_3856729 [Mycena olivaceomarginata]
MWTMSKADAFGVPDVDIVAAAEEADEIGAGGGTGGTVSARRALKMLQLFG